MSEKSEPTKNVVFRDMTRPGGGRAWIGLGKDGEGLVSQMLKARKAKEAPAPADPADPKTKA